MRIETERRIPTHQHSDGSSPTRRSGRTDRRVLGNIRRHDNGIASIPGTRFAPQERIQEGCGATVTCIDHCGAFQIGVARKQLGQDCFGGFGLVDERFGSDFETADVGRVDLVSKEDDKRGIRGEWRGC
jgi:hypothetical protein